MLWAPRKGTYQIENGKATVSWTSAVVGSQVIGTPVFTIPYLGYLVSYIQSTSRRYATIAVGTVLLMMLLRDIIFGDDRNAKEKRQ